MNDQPDNVQRQIWTLDPPYAALDNEDRRVVEEQDQAKRTVHFSWGQAWRAENEREKAKLLCCNENPTAGPLKLFAANVVKELPNLKAKAIRFLSLKSH